MGRKGRKFGERLSINERNKAETEKVELFSAVLQNKDLLENKSLKYEDCLARELKWKEIASKLSFLGKRRNFQELRRLYGRMKSATKMKYQSADPTKVDETNFVMELSAADQVLRQICPDFFPKFAVCHQGAKQDGTELGISTEEPQNGSAESKEDSSKPQEKEPEAKSSKEAIAVVKRLEKSRLAKNQINISKPDLIVEPSTSSNSQNPASVENIESEMVALSLELVENSDAARTQDFRLSQVDIDLGFGKLSEQELIDYISESASCPDDPQSVWENQKTPEIENSDVKEISDEKMAMKADAKKLPSGESESSINDDPSKLIIENLEFSSGNVKKVDGNSTDLEKLDKKKIDDNDEPTTSDNPFPEFPVFELTGKRKKNSRPKQRKKRKVSKSAR